MSTIFRSAGIITLETSDRILLKQINKLFVTDSLLYVLDKNRGLYLFDKQGQYKRQVGQIGTGPGEYVRLTDFTIDDEQGDCYLLDPQRQVVLCYDKQGRWNKTWTLPLKGRVARSIHYNKGKLYAELYTTDSSEKAWLLGVFDVKTEKLNALLLDATNCSKGWNEMFGTDQSTFSTTSSQDARFLHVFSDTIYQFTEENVSPYIVFESKHLLQRDDLQRLRKKKNPADVFHALNEMHRIYNPSNYLETNHWLYLTYSEGNQGSHALFYDKIQRKACIIPTLINDLLYTDNIKIKPATRFFFTDKTRAYSIEMNSMTSRMLFEDILKKGGIHPATKGYERLSTLPEDSNPIIVYYEFN